VRYGQIYWSKIAVLTYPHLYLAPPLRVTALEFREIFGSRKLEGLPFHVV